MSDGNIGFARGRLERAVDDLCAPKMRLFGQTVRRGPSLYAQLADSIAGSTGNAKTPARTSLAPVWIDALQLRTTIDTTTQTWCPTPGDTPQRLAALRDKAWRPQDTDHVETCAATITGWARSITQILNPEAIKHISAPCPSCGARTVYRKDSAGETVRQPALTLTAHGCSCAKCQTYWAPDRYLWLCRLLGFDLPAGILE